MREDRNRLWQWCRDHGLKYIVVFLLLYDSGVQWFNPQGWWDWGWVFVCGAVAMMIAEHTPPLPLLRRRLVSWLRDQPVDKGGA